MGNLILWIWVSLWMSSAFATEPQEFEWAVQKHEDLLYIHWRDSEPVTNSCGFTLRSFHYLPKTKGLSISVQREHCGFEFLDQSRGVHIWRLPYHLAKSAELQLFLEGRPIGRIEIENEAAKLHLESLPRSEERL